MMTNLEIISKIKSNFTLDKFLSNFTLTEVIGVSYNFDFYLNGSKNLVVRYETLYLIFGKEIKLFEHDDIFIDAIITDDMLKMDMIELVLTYGRDYSRINDFDTDSLLAILNYFLD